MVQVDDSAVLHEGALKEAIVQVLRDVAENYRRAAICRASMNPEIEELAPLYETIGDTWVRHASRILAFNPPLPKTKARKRKEP